MSAAPLDAFWMPFTPNRQFKSTPRLVVSAEGLRYRTPEGREVLDGIHIESEGAFFSAELLIKLQAAGATVVEVGVPHYARTAGSPTGARPAVVLRAVRDFWRLRLAMWANRERAIRRGRPVQGEPPV